MESGPVWNLAGWCLLALVCAGLALAALVVRRGLRLRARFVYREAGGGGAPGAEWLLAGVGVVVFGAAMYAAAEGRSAGLRVAWSVAGVAAAVAAVLWARASIRDAAAQQREGRKHWRREGAEARRQIREWVEAAAVRAAACRALSHGLQATDVRFYGREEKVYRLGYDTTGREDGPKEYAAGAPLVARLEGLPRPRAIEFDDDGARMAVPCAAGLSLDGFFVVGGGPFSAAQQEFALEVAAEAARSLAVAAQVSKQVEARVSAQMERRELEQTRRALQHLVAPDLPAVAQLDYAAEYWRGDRPGGQFLDMVSLPQGALGVVLADLSGYGLDAAVRMAQLQTLLRSRFWAYAEDLPELLQSTERALRAARPATAPVRIFVGVYRPARRTLTYVNAGVVAPLLLRRGGEGAQVLRLTQTAPMLAGPPGGDSIQVADLVLESGDVLAMFNHGVTEAANPGAEPFGEAHLTETIMAWETQRAADLVSLVLRSVEEHTAHAKNAHDRVLLLFKAV